jgi:hypothetical protein
MVTMGSGFQTTLQDLANAAGSFHDGADQFAKALGAITTLKADSGDDGLDETVQAVLAAIDALHGLPAVGCELAGTLRRHHAGRTDRQGLR